MLQDRAPLIQAKRIWILAHQLGLLAEGQLREQQVAEFIANVVAWGGSKMRDVTDDAGYFAVMQDPEGNEFCIGGGAGSSA